MLIFSGPLGLKLFAFWYKWHYHGNYNASIGSIMVILLWWLYNDLICIMEDICIWFLSLMNDDSIELCVLWVEKPLQLFRNFLMSFFYYLVVKRVNYFFSGNIDDLHSLIIFMVFHIFINWTCFCLTLEHIFLLLSSVFSSDKPD